MTDSQNAMGQMLFVIGLLLVLYGGWWLGAMWVTGPITNSRVQGGYMIGGSLAGIGLVLILS